MCFSFLVEVEQTADSFDQVGRVGCVEFLAVERVLGASVAAGADIQGSIAGPLRRGRQPQDAARAVDAQIAVTRDRIDLERGRHRIGRIQRRPVIEKSLAHRPENFRPGQVAARAGCVGVHNVERHLQRHAHTRLGIVLHRE